MENGWIPINEIIVLAAKWFWSTVNIIIAYVFEIGAFTFLLQLEKSYFIIIIPWPISQPIKRALHYFKILFRTYPSSPNIACLSIKVITKMRCCRALHSQASVSTFPASRKIYTAPITSMWASLFYFKIKFFRINFRMENTRSVAHVNHGIR